MIFFVGLDDVASAKHFERCFISVNRLKTRKSDFLVGDWIMDSGAFTELSTHGHYRDAAVAYAEHIIRWSKCGNNLAAVSQDYMCEPFILEKTGLSLAEHQRLTIERYDNITGLVGSRAYVMPVLQGYAPSDYVQHIRAYGRRLKSHTWVGVGSVCKRNKNADSVIDVLLAIRSERPDLRLHGFGIKTTSLQHAIVHDLLYSADSMAWSFAARMEGRNAHDWNEARRFAERIEQGPTIFSHQYKFSELS